MNWLIEKCEAVRRSTIRRGAVETVSGYAPLALPLSTGERVRMMTVYGRSVQNGTPAPDAPVSVVGVEGKCRSRGKNLLNRGAISLVNITADGVTRYGWLFNNLPAGSYKLSAFGNYVNTRAAAYKTISNGVYSTYYTLQTYAPVATISISAGQGLVIYMYQGVTSLNDDEFIQLELGSLATPYAPFASPSIIAHPTLHGIPLASTATDYTYIDSNGVKYAADTWTWREEGVWEHVQRVGAKVFDGTSFISDIVLHDNGLANINIAKPADAGGSAMYGSKILCSHETNIAVSYGQYPNIYQGSSAFIWTESQDIFGTTIASASSFLSAQYAAGTPVTVYYRLANPIVTQYTHVPWMHTIDASHAGNPLDIAYLDNVDGTAVMPWIQASYYKEVIL